MEKSFVGTTLTVGGSTSCSFLMAPTHRKVWPPRWRQSAEVLMLQEILWPSPSCGFGQSLSHRPTSLFSWLMNPCLLTLFVQKQIKSSHPSPLLFFSEPFPVLLQKYQSCWFHKAWIHNLSTAKKQQLFWWFSRGIFQHERDMTTFYILQPQVFLPVILFTFFLVRLPAIPAAWAPRLYPSKWTLLRG